MRISVVIPTLNAGPQFAELLKSLRAQQPSPPSEIIVVDSGSQDDTCKLACDSGGRVVELNEPFNHGLTRDIGIGSANGDIIFLTVQDAAPASNDCLARMMAPFDDPEVAGVTGRQIPPPDGPLELQIKAQLDEPSAAPEKISLAAHPNYAQYSPAERLNLYRFDNVCSAIRRSVWVEIPFGECRYAEDYQWAQKVLEAGHTLVREPNALMWHAHRRKFWYEFRRGLLDAWVLDQAFAYHYKFFEKLNRAKLLVRGGVGEGRPDISTRLGAFKIYFAHVLARWYYWFHRVILKRMGKGQAALEWLTKDI
ncbi:MAG: glycosyltransferase [Planctomycetota bacterium]